MSPLTSILPVIFYRGSAQQNEIHAFVESLSGRRSTKLSFTAQFFSPKLCLIDSSRIFLLFWNFSWNSRHRFLYIGYSRSSSSFTRTTLMNVKCILYYQHVYSQHAICYTTRLITEDCKREGLQQQLRLITISSLTASVALSMVMMFL